MVSASSSSAWTTLAHIYMSFRQVALRSSTLPFRSVHAAKVPRLTLRSTLSPLPTVLYLFLSFVLRPFWLTNVFMRVYDLLVIGNLEDLIRHGLHALRETLQQDKELTTNNTSIGIVGPGGVHEGHSTPVDFRILEGPPIEAYLQTMQPKDIPPPPASASTTASGSAQPAAGGDDDVQMSEQ
jgi:hypothetical protein